MIGQTISHYKILEKLGEGGMGVVYKAQDLKLDRTVALKFLPHHLTASETEQARFLQEAKSAAALNHPNVCSVIDIQEADGKQFIVMEYVDGVTLRQKVPIQKIDDAIRYAIQMGEALQSAHAKGVIHRDVKSENVMVTADGNIKVMDFGLAKLKGSLRLTKESSTVGTLAYMAPEQIHGDEVDARSDIFSFGVVLFEMLTGKLPFRGEHDAAVMYSIINEQPMSLTSLRSDAPAEFDRIIQRALEKDPADRYQHADDLVSELRRLRKQSGPVSKPVERIQPVGRRRNTFVLGIAGALALVAIVSVLVLRQPGTDKTQPTSTRKMLVVLPFENLGASDQEYFADGLTEEITSKLSGLSGLGVIARSSAMQYKKTTKSVQQIASELKVKYALQGTVRWESSNGTMRVRVNPQLINVDDGTQIWSQPSEAVLSSSFKLQSDIAGQVANALDVTLLQPEKRSLETVVTNNAEAYDSYLRGNEYLYRSTGERDLRIAEQMFEKAVTLDPTFAVAYAKLAALHSHFYWEFYDHTAERVRKSKEAAERALQLDPNGADAHGAMGWYYYHCLRDYDRALKEFNIALDVQPNNTDLLLGIGAINRRIGKWEDAIHYFNKIVEIDPRSPGMVSDLAVTYAYVRKYAEAIQYYDRTIALAPDIVENYYVKGLVLLLWKGDTQSAGRIVVDAMRQKIGREDPGFIYYSVYIHLVSGNYEEAMKFLELSGYEILDYQYWRYPKTLLLGQLFDLLKQPEKSRSMYGAARVVLEHEIQQHPDDSRLHGSLGIAYAGMGKKVEAIREGKRGVELMPISVDASVGPERVRELAQIYAMVGEQNAAVDQLEKLLSISSLMSAPLLRIDPTWNSLRGNARFQKLIAEKQ